MIKNIDCDRVPTEVSVPPAAESAHRCRNFCTKGRAMQILGISQPRFERLGLVPVEIRLLKGRVKFEGAESSAPFPSAVVVFRPAQYRLMSAMRGKLAAVTAITAAGDAA